MKLSINLFLFYSFLFITYCFVTTDSRFPGRDMSVSGATHISDESKYKSKRAEIYSEGSLNLYGSNLPKPTLKQNIGKPIEMHSNSVISRNKNDVSEIIFHENPINNKPNILSMDVGKNTVKVSSALHSKHLVIKSKGGQYELSVNPKFSHIIEILPRKELSTMSEKKFAHSDMSTESLGIMEEVLTERSDLDSNFGGGLNGEERSIETCSGTRCLTSPEEIISQLSDSDRAKSNVFSTTESPKLPSKGMSSEIFESTILHPDEDLISDKMISTEMADLETRSGVGQGSAFSDEFESSGEEFSSEDVGSDRNAQKDGRLLSLFSPRNDSSPSCTTPKGESGQCRPIRQCLLSDALNNFNVFLQHLCLVRGALVGVCCPDNPVIEITNPDENSTDSNSEKTVIIQPPEGCGLNTKTRIVGGTISAPHEWTWMVALLRRNRFYCGGVIINNWYILTAAHCVLGMNVKDLTVRLGEYDFNALNKNKEDISVAEIKRHAQFVTLTFQHDIALLKLQRSIKYSKFVGSICLPTQKARDFSDAEGTVVGWGTVSFGGAASPVLRQVTIPIWKNEDCDRTYFLENISDAFMCAGSPEKGEDACQGDSGGPLMTQNDKGRWEVIGIVSWGRRCGDPTYPGVYTRVTTYLDWILQNIN